MKKLFLIFLIIILFLLAMLLSSCNKELIHEEYTFPSYETLGLTGGEGDSTSIVFESEDLMQNCIENLKKHEIFTRRYFYPSLATSLPYVENTHLPLTEDIAKRVLCLPLYYDLTIEEVDLICRHLLRIQNN